MPRGKRSFRRVRGAVLVGALVAVGLSGCSLIPGAAGHSGGAAPVGGDTAGPSDPAVTSISPASGTVRGGTKVVVHGQGLADVASVTIGGTSVHATATDGSVAFTTPQASAFAPAKDPVVLRTTKGASVAATRFTYKEVNGVDRELAYVLKYWKHYNPAYDIIAGDDCVDFTSQALLQRGWKQQGDWTSNTDVADSGAAWRSSTAFEEFMTEHPSLGTALTDDQRSKVKVGDVVQFDWDRSGDRDHTGVVTRVTREKNGHIDIYFAGHTNDSAYRSVDTAITKDHPGGVAYYWSLK